VATLIGDPIERVLTELHERLRHDYRGEVSASIPALANADHRLFGLAVCSPDGFVSQAGDAEVEFSVQSISKAFAYALALNDRGLESVHGHVGAEPSGEAFSAISLEEDTGRPDNPMINAGAIVTCALVSGADAHEKYQRIHEVMEKAAGRDLAFDDDVYADEQQSSDRNRALAHFMRSAGSLTDEVDPTMEVYLKQCSVLVTTRDLAVMGATLARGGINPVTGERVFSGEVARHVLTVMATCGMYDYSGEWLLTVGTPAKSGVSGGLITASPGQFGMGLFSPKLDARGNSVRAVAASQDLADRFQLHALTLPGGNLPAVRESESRWPELGAGIVAVQGDLVFASMRGVLHAMEDVLESSDRVLVLDLDRVTRVHAVGERILQDAIDQLQKHDHEVVVVDGERRGIVDGAAEVETLDEAREWCEGG
jgi:glutaminase